MGIDKSFLPVSSSAKLAALSGEFKRPKGKSYNQPHKCLEAFKLLKLRIDKLKMLGRPLSQQNLLSVIRAAQEVIECEASIARELLQPFYCCWMNKRTIDLMCWQIAGNRKRMLSQKVNVYNGRKEELGWMSAVIAEHLSDLKYPLGCYRVRVVDGPAAGFDLYMPVPKAFWLFSDVLGATYRQGKDRLRITAPKEAVQMQVMVYPEALRLTEFKAHSSHVSLNTLSELNSISCIKAGVSQKKRNLELAKTRQDKCPNQHKNPCHICAVGYDACFRGCKPNSSITLPAEVDLLVKGKNLCQKISEEA